MCHFFQVENTKNNQLFEAQLHQASEVKAWGNEYIRLCFYATEPNVKLTTWTPTMKISSLQIQLVFYKMVIYAMLCSQGFVISSFHHSPLVEHYNGIGTFHGA